MAKRELTVGDLFTYNENGQTFLLIGFKPSGKPVIATKEERLVVFDNKPIWLEDKKALRQYYTFVKNTGLVYEFKGMQEAEIDFEKGLFTDYFL